MITDIKVVVKEANGNVYEFHEEVRTLLDTLAGHVCFNLEKNKPRQACREFGGILKDWWCIACQAVDIVGRR